METKICIVCKGELPNTTEYFYKGKKGKLRNQCKICYAIVNYRDSNTCRKSYLARKESILEYKKEFYQRSKEKRRIYNIGKKFGITEWEYQDLMNDQRGLCKICGRSLVNPDSIRSPAVDHNHKTGQIRALLCADCNTALGLVHESPTTLRSMITYIEEYDQS
jgi:hypothetical protein